MSNDQNALWANSGRLGEHSMSRIVIWLTILFFGSPAMAFDCSGVKLPYRVVICSDLGLIQPADERQQAFNEASWGKDGNALLNPQYDKELWENQRNWVRVYATECGRATDRPIPKLPVTSN